MLDTTVAGRYKIEEQIGIGGMGIVYRACDETLGREVALKVIAPHLMQQEEARKRFQREAQAVAGLTHPNIVTVYDFAEDKDAHTVCLVMELLHGASLRQRMADANRPAFSDVAIQMCRALEAAHGKGILHRDIKPENIFVCGDGTLKLMDFGLARLLGASSNTQTSAVAGTVSYMAPELLRGEKLDERTDLYSLGVLLYEYLSGSTPFAADNPGTVLLKHLTEAPPPLRDRLLTLPVEIENIVMRLLAKDPAMRYASASALRSALENPTPSGTTTQVELANTFAALPKLPPPAFAAPPAITRPIPPPASAIPFAPSSSRGPIYASGLQEKRRSPAIQAGLGALLLLLGGGAFAAYQWRQQTAGANAALVQKVSGSKQKKRTAKSNGKVSPTDNSTPDEVAALSRSVQRTQAQLEKERRERERLQRELQAKQNTGNAAPAPGPDVPPPVVADDTGPDNNNVLPPSKNENRPAPAPPRPPLRVSGSAVYLPQQGGIVRLLLQFNSDCNVRFYTVQADEAQVVNVASSLDRLNVSESGQGSAPVDLTPLSGVPSLVLMVASARDLSNLPPSFALPAGVSNPNAVLQQTVRQRMALQRGRRNGRDTVVRLFKVGGGKRKS